MTRLALQGVKVVELCSLAAGPFCGKLLADMGAEVVKVEQPGLGDPSRHRGPYPPSGPNPEASGLFFYFNTNKQSLALSMQHSEGRGVFFRLMQWADMLLEDTSPGTLDSLGMGYPALAKVNPRLIVTSITPFGQTGPNKHHKVYPINAFSAGGATYLLAKGEGFGRRPPLQPGRHYGDCESGVGASVAAMAALYWQRLTGKGQHIDCSRQEWTMGLNRWYIARYANDGDVEGRGANSYPWGGVLPCKDGYICLICPRDYEWDRLVEAMDNPEWASDERFRDNFSRAQNGLALNQLLSNWLKDYSKADACRHLQAAGVAAGQVNTVSDMLDSPQFQERDLFMEAEHPIMGKVRFPRLPFRMSVTPAELRRQPPSLGADSRQVLSALGYAQEEIDTLEAQGVIVGGAL
ncbi:MAG: CaiB/BaiF CoA-transferase family protein [Dehalococcoidia bacterium]|nr:CaiB/BaiF CoA-transferase family protein [Dehalococcoidia bacterium]